LKGTLSARRLALCHTRGMGQMASDVGRKIIAIAVLLVAAYILFKMVIGVVAAVAWIVVLVLAVVAAIWAFGVLRT
jgi:uncharacterized membrane protein